MRVVRFKKPGSSITVGGQTFHQGNTTPEMAKELLRLGVAKEEDLEIVEQDIKSEADGEEPAKETKPARSRKPADEEKE